MPKTRSQKETELTHITEQLKSAKSVVFSGFSKLNVKEITELRRLLRNEGVTVTVAKRTLLQRAMKELNLPVIEDSVFTGGVQVAISQTEETAPARVLQEYTKKHEALTLRAGLLDGVLLSKAQVVALAQLPGKDALRGQLLSVIAAPLRGFVTVMAGPMRGLVTVLSKRSEQSA